MIEETTGLVEAKKGDGKAILIDGDWYSSYMGIGLRKVDRGDKVTIIWKHDKTGRWKNIQGDATILEKGEEVMETATAPSEVSAPRVTKVGAIILDRERAIIRQNALTNAVKWCDSGAGITIDVVISTAKVFEAYTSGDADKLKAEEILKDMNPEE